MTLRVFTLLIICFAQPVKSETSTNSCFVQDQYQVLFDEGMKNYNMGEFNQAISYFEKALAIKPDDKEATQMIAKCKYAKQSREKEMDDQPKKILKIAETNFSEGNYKDALKYFERYKSLKPDDISVDEKIKVCKEKIGG